MTYRIVFTDIDGTLLSHTSGSIPKHALEAIDALQTNGIQVWGCTGRSIMELRTLPLNGFHPDGWITMNGAFCFQSDTVIYEAPINPHDIAVLIEEIEKDPFPVQFLEAETNYMNMFSQEVADALAKIHTAHDPVMDYHRALQNPVYMFIPWLYETRWKDIYAKMQYTTQVRWNDLAVDCFSQDCGKDKGIQAVLSYLHLSKDDALSIGDGENDIEMFRACGTSIAMGNAKDTVKEKADYITKSIDEDGFSHIIFKLFAL